MEELIFIPQLVVQKNYHVTFFRSCQPTNFHLHLHAVGFPSTWMQASIVIQESHYLLLSLSNLCVISVNLILMSADKWMVPVSLSASTSCVAVSICIWCLNQANSSIIMWKDTKPKDLELFFFLDASFVCVRRCIVSYSDTWELYLVTLKGGFILHK